MSRSGSSPEVDRLHHVYEAYDCSETVQSRWSTANPGNRAIHRERADRLGSLVARLDGPVLDLGCGSGQALAELAGSRVGGLPRVGVDLSEPRARAAAAQVGDAAFVCAEGSTLPFGAGCFGAVLTFTLFSSVLDEALAGAIAGEVARVVRPGGVVVWYDLRRPNPRNDQVRALRRPDISRLFPGWTVSLRPATLLPPLARRLGPATGALYPLLARLRPLDTHLLGVLAKPA